MQFDMEQEVTVWGVAVKPRCDEPHNHEGVISLRVVRSHDEIKWHDASDVIHANYVLNHTSNSWFEEAASARYWRIQVLTWQSRPSMKADLIGLPKGRYLFGSLYGTISHITGTIL